MFDARVSVYSVSRCGYYQKKKDILKFGSLPEVLEDIYKWIKQDQPTILETKTYNVGEESSNLPSYCYDIEKNDQGDFALVLWNEIPLTEGKVASIQGEGRAGSVSVKTSDIPEGNIAGYPTYFYFIAKKNILVTICFENKINGIRNLSRYTRGYMERFSKWVARKNGDRPLDSEILGFRPTPQSQIEQGVVHKFIVSPKRNEGDVKLIKKNRMLITKMIKKEEFTSNKKESKNNFLKFMQVFGLHERTLSKDTSHQYKLEIDFPHPSAEELKTVMDNYFEDPDESEGECWTDIGFTMKGGKTYWLGGSHIRMDIGLRFSKKETVVKAGKILKVMDEHKELIIQKYEE